MVEVSIVGADLAKQVFQLHGAGSDGRVIFRKKQSWPQFARFIEALPPRIVCDGGLWNGPLLGMGDGTSWP